MAEQTPVTADLLVGATERVATDTEKRVRELLDRHQDLVAPGVAHQIIQREVSRATEEYGARRLEGHANDNFSKAPGMTIFMTDHAKASLVPIFEEAGYAVPAEQWQPSLNNTWSIAFPAGAYSMGMGGYSFYQEADPDLDSGKGSRRKPFSTPYDSIIRVEGKSGELWQNVHFNWDGTPKAR